MTPEAALRVLAAAARLDPGAELALGIAAVTGASRAELAALRWDDLDGARLTIDSSVVVQRDRDDDRAGPTLIDASIAPVGDRSVALDPATVRMIQRVRPELSTPGPYLFSVDDGPANPERIGEWWARSCERAGVRARFDELHDALGPIATATVTASAPAAAADSPGSAASPVPVESPLPIAAAAPPETRPAPEVPATAVEPVAARGRLARLWLKLIDMDDSAPS